MLPQFRKIAPPELLAPAGDHECLRAAIENGADAVYFGLANGFNARARAVNFTIDALSETMAELHRQGVKGYITFNTLVFPSELAAAEKSLEAIAKAGADALLIQDFGVARLAKTICPDLPIHASTQMTLTSAEGIEAAKTLGIERVVLARELSLAEIRSIRKETDLSLEVFVHGALCVAYSGQCLTSESLGGRSANRGQCAQACRLPYELICDEKLIDLGEQKYLLSPQDLAAYDMTAELIAAGVGCFKIEGRLKTPEYVANITSQYRKAIDAAVAGLAPEISDKDVRDMQLSFSRGFSHGWLDGCDHKMLVPAISSSKRGVLLGKVESVNERYGRVRIEAVGPVKAGDGLAFEQPRGQEHEIGGRVYHVFQNGQRVEGAGVPGLLEIDFGRNHVDVARIEPGQRVWTTDDPELSRRLRKTFADGPPRRKLAIQIDAFAAVGQKLRLTVTAGAAAPFELVTDEPLAEAQKHALSEEVLREQLGRLGATTFELALLNATIEGRPMAPLSVLGKLRRELIAKLEEIIPQSGRREVTNSNALASLLHPPEKDASQKSLPRLHVLCRSLDQLRAVLDAGERSIYVDFADIRQYGEAVQLAHARGATIHLATPRIQKPDEMGIFRVMAKHGADGILARNLGGLAFFKSQNIPCVADFSLNVANPISLDFIESFGVTRATASYDLNRDQLEDLVGSVDASRLEVVIHQHMPLFHMEHCVFCAVLSPGTNKTNCGRPCDDKIVRLRDHVGVEHPLTADVGCRNTLFNAVPQSAAEAVPWLLQAGISNFRVELLNDAPQAEIARLISLYRDLLACRIPGKEVWKSLRAMNQVGVTRGTLEERKNPLALL
jgi:putative protease